MRLALLLLAALIAPRGDDGEGWVTHHAALSVASDTAVFGQMHAEQGTSWLILRDLSEDRERLRLRYSNPVRSMSFTPDGLKLATSQDRGKVLVFDVATGKQLAELTGHHSWVWSVALSPDGNRVASVGRDKTVRLWDLGEQKEIWKQSHETHVNDVVFAADGKSLFVAHHSGPLERWNLSGEKVSTLRAAGKYTLSTTRSDDGRWLVTGHHDGTVSVWNLEKDKPERHFTGPKGAIYAVAITPDGSRIAASSAERVVLEWSVKGDDAVTHRLPAGQRNVLALGFTGESKLIGVDYHGRTRRFPLPKAERGE